MEKTKDFVHILRYDDWIDVYFNGELIYSDSWDDFTEALMDAAGIEFAGISDVLIEDIEETPKHFSQLPLDIRKRFENPDWKSEGWDEH